MTKGHDMTPNELLKQWGIREGLPETFGAGAWYDNRVRVVEVEGALGLEWNDQAPVTLTLLSKGRLALVRPFNRIVPVSVGVRAFALACKFEAIYCDHNPRVSPPRTVAPFELEAVAQAVTDAITDAIAATPAAAEPPAPPKRASRKRGEVA